MSGFGDKTRWSGTQHRCDSSKDSSFSKGLVAGGWTGLSVLPELCDVNGSEVPGRPVVSGVPGDTGISAAARMGDDSSNLLVADD